MLKKSGAGAGLLEFRGSSETKTSYQDTRMMNDHVHNVTYFNKKKKLQNYNFEEMSECPSTEMSATVSLGAGCYWGTEKYIKTDFQKLFPNSIKQSAVGFMSPDKNQILLARHGEAD